MTGNESTDHTPEEIFNNPPKPEDIVYGPSVAIESMSKSMKPVDHDDSA